MFVLPAGVRHRAEHLLLRHPGPQDGLQHSPRLQGGQQPAALQAREPQALLPLLQLQGILASLYHLERHCI